MTRERQAAQDETLYPKIGDVVDAEDDKELMPTELESLCMNCQKNGRTRLLFTQIPFFREVILMSFKCPHCGFSNNEIQTGARIQDKGCKYTLKVTSEEDLQRQVVKSDAATFRVQDLDFEIPRGKGVLTTIEGLLRTALDQLRDSQDDRREVDPGVAEQVGDFIVKLALLLSGSSLPFTVELDDPSGNSFLQNPHAPKMDPHLHWKEYFRNKEQQQALGLQINEYEVDQEEPEAKEKRRAELAATFHKPAGATITEREAAEHTVDLDKEVFEIPTNCPNCGTEGTSKTCLTDIPFFKEVIIMAFDCPSESCGYKTNEIKGGGAIPDKGKILRLEVEPRNAENPGLWKEDMKRDVVKSNSAGVSIPELDIEITQGSLGGMYTTVEGLLALAKDSLFEGQAGDMSKGDSATQELRDKFEDLERRFEKILSGEQGFTLEIRDPLANSFIFSPTAPEPEPRLSEEDYERTFDENEDLGLNDMCTEGYDDVPAAQDGRPNLAPSATTSLDQGRFEGPFETFAGHREGMVFRSGIKGLGYYEDAAARRAGVQAKMKQLQHDGAAAHPQADILNPPTV